MELRSLLHAQGEEEHETGDILESWKNFCHCESPEGLSTQDLQCPLRCAVFGLHHLTLLLGQHWCFDVSIVCLRTTPECALLFIVDICVFTGDIACVLFHKGL